MVAMEQCAWLKEVIFRGWWRDKEVLVYDRERR